MRTVLAAAMVIAVGVAPLRAGDEPAGPPPVQERSAAQGGPTPAASGPRIERPPGRPEVDIPPGYLELLKQRERQIKERTLSE